MVLIERLWTKFFSALSLGVLGLVLLVTCSVVTRTGDFADLYWVEDVCRLILLWIGLLFVSAIQFEDRHIASDFLHLGPRWFRRGRDVLKQLVFMVIGVVWIFYGGITVQREMDMFGAGGMELPLYYFNAVIPVAGFLLVVVAIVKLRAMFVPEKLPPDYRVPL